MSKQLDGFPLRVVIFHPHQNKPSKHAAGWAECDDGEKYIVKGYNNAPTISANEWVCTALADLLHLPTPVCKVLQMPNGELVFGSRFIANELPPLVATRLLLSGAAANDLIAPELVTNLAKLYALDLLIGNPDRHGFNFFFTLDSQNDNAQRVARLHAIDFDAADLLSRTRATLPMATATQTVSTARRIRQVHTFKPSASHEMLTHLDSRRQFIFEEALHGLPEEWLPGAERDRFLRHVVSDSFSDTIRELDQGLSNGTYL